MTKENLLVITIVGFFVLLVVGGFAGLHVSGTRAAVRRQKAESERIAEVQRQQEAQEAAAIAEARERERQRIAAEQRRQEEQERQRLAAEQLEREQQEFERIRKENEEKADVDFILYGKTLGNADFDLKSLRGQYVLVKFTATWCPACQAAIPYLLEAHKKYHNKGFEIVSVHTRERPPDPVATVRRFVQREKLPWIILSEELSKRAGQPEYKEKYQLRGVPTMLLVDKEGKIIVPPTHGYEWHAKLAEIFE